MTSHRGDLTVSSHFGVRVRARDKLWNIWPIPNVLLLICYSHSIHHDHLGAVGHWRSGRGLVVDWKFYLAAPGENEKTSLNLSPVRLDIDCSSFPDELHVSLSSGLKNRQLCIFINLTAGRERSGGLTCGSAILSWLLHTAPSLDQKRRSCRWSLWRWDGHDRGRVSTGSGTRMRIQWRPKLLMELLAICFLSENGSRGLSVESKG